jgi:hypothetical protein
MPDPEFEHAEKQTTSRGPRLLPTFLSLLGVWFLLSCSISGPRRFTCAACRLDRVDRGFLGFRWSAFEESECSRWYAAHVESRHTHIWASCGHCQRFGIPGIYGGFACSIGEPIAGLSKSFQIRVYQRFRDPMKAKSLFLQLGHDHQMMGALIEWMETDGKESWDEWWQRRDPSRRAGTTHLPGPETAGGARPTNMKTRPPC